jgi:hypothetical protein
LINYLAVIWKNVEVVLPNGVPSTETRLAFGMKYKDEVII